MPLHPLRQPSGLHGFLFISPNLAKAKFVHKRTKCIPGLTMALPGSPEARLLWRLLQGLRKPGTMKPLEGRAAIVRLELPGGARVRRSAVDPDTGARDVGGSRRQQINDRRRDFGLGAEPLQWHAGREIMQL